MNHTSKYEINVQDEAKAKLIGHALFLAKESPSAALKMLESFDQSIDMIAQFPMASQFADEMDAPRTPPKTYRRRVFAKNYKIFYRIDGQMIKVTAVIDSRAENKDLFRGDESSDTSDEEI